MKNENSKYAKTIYIDEDGVIYMREQLENTKYKTIKEWKETIGFKIQPFKQIKIIGEQLTLW